LGFWLARHGVVHALLALVVLVWVVPVLTGDYPPGVDTPTFLHLSWVAEQAITGKLPNPFIDPYWYGGFSYLKAYPPLAYGLVGLIGALPGVNVIDVYGAMLVLSLIALAAATYWLGLEMGLRRITATSTAVLCLLAYPTLASVYLWGWYTSLLALALALFGFVCLMRAVGTGKLRFALAAGVFFGLTVLTHHMTAVAFGLGLAVSLAIMFALRAYPRPLLARHAFIAGGVALLLSLPWGVVFVLHIINVGFRREIAGNWLVFLSHWRRNVLDETFIGSYWYPSYLGNVLFPAGAVGLVYALTKEARWIALAAMVLLFGWFSMGSSVMPLYKLFPFSGLDVARFPVYMTPFLVLLVGKLLEGIVKLVQDAWPRARRPALSALVTGALIISVAVFPFRDALHARSLAEPYRVPSDVRQAMIWVKENVPVSYPDTTVFAVGFWTWSNFLLPYEAGQPVAGGWADEGAENWRDVRQLRYMSWSGQIDARISHALFRRLGVSWVLVYDSYFLESPNGWVQTLESNPRLFVEGPRWGAVRAFLVL
jgi:uncharacterized membrane protein